MSSALIRVLLIALAPLGFAITGCGGSEGAQAAGTVGAAVALTAVHRAETGDCVAVCSRGYTCNERTGLCEKGDCDPSCPEGYRCTVSPTGNSCEPRPAPSYAFDSGSASTTVSGRPTERARDTAGTPGEPRPAAQDLTPSRNSAGQVQIAR